MTLDADEDTLFTVSTSRRKTRYAVSEVYFRRNKCVYYKLHQMALFPLPTVYLSIFTRSIFFVACVYSAWDEIDFSPAEFELRCTNDGS